MSLERHINTKTTPWTGEHIHRYLESKKYVNNSDVVLDLACGSGYGTDILSQVANSKIYGGDIEESAIIQCKKDWAHNSSLFFEVMDATNLRFEDNYFDKIVSLETIEHLVEYKKMLSEFCRVVKPNGTVIISTPNIKISSPDGTIINPYHTQEFTYEELNTLLKAEFKEVSILGQKYKRYLNSDNMLMNFFESLLLLRGVRKLPYSFRNKVFSGLFNRSLYPLNEDFDLFSDKSFIEKHCHVLFAVCKK